MALAGVMLGWILLAEREGGPAPAVSAQVLPGLKVALVARVELVLTNQTLRAERAGEQWTLTAPLNYPGQKIAIESLLAACAQLRVRAVVPEREVRSQPRGLADFGLQPPQAALMLDNGQTGLRIGAHTPVGGQVYVQRAGAKEVFLVDAEFLGRLPRTADDWRDPALLQLAGLAFNRLEVRPHPPGFEVRRDETNQLWRLTYPMETRADNPRLKDLLSLLPRWPVKQFVTDDPKADLEPFGLQRPETELVFGQGTNDLLVVQFGGSPTNDPASVYARRLSHTNIVLVPRELLDVLRLPHTEYRDRRLFTFKSDAVETVTVRSEEPFTLRRGPNDSWRVEAPYNFAADPALVRALLNQLGEIEVADFVKDVVTDFAVYGLATPARSYLLQGSGRAGSTNFSLADFAFGRVVPPDKIYARRLDENAVYVVAVAEALKLPSAPWQLRDRRLWNFDLSAVQGATITFHGQTRKIVRAEKGGWTLATPGIINPFAVDEALHRLTELRAEAWTARGADKLARYGFDEVAHAVTLEVRTGEKLETFTLQFGRRSPKFSVYATTVLDGQPVVFEFPQRLFDEYMTPYLTILPP